MTLPEDEPTITEPGVGTGTGEMTVSRRRLKELRRLVDQAAEEQPGLPQMASPVQEGSEASESVDASDAPRSRFRGHLALLGVALLLAAVFGLFFWAGPG